MISFKDKPDSSEDIKNLLHPYIREWFFSKFKEFSLPQKFGVMEVHSRNNILISAPTGSGKTITAFLAILNELIDSSEKGILQDKVYCIYISPLKALNNDIHKNLIEPLKEIEEIAGKKFGIRVSVRTGDTTVAEKAKMLAKPPHILITTPESCAILLNSIKFRDFIKNIDWCIVDEIHSLAENKRGVHLSLSLERLQHLSPGMCRIGLSATISPLEEIARFLVGYERKCKIVDSRFNKDFDIKVISPVDDLINTTYEAISNETYKLIDKLIHEHRTTLIFTNTRSGTERVVHHLKTKFPKKYTEITEDDPTGYSSLIGAHHGSLSKEHRFKMEDALRKGKLKCIVSSTSLELGLDIGYIDLVICLGSPKSIARLLQRAGRSGHQLHSTIKARIIATDRDDLVECCVMVKDAIERKIDRIHIPTNCLDVLAQQIDGLALEQVWDVGELYKLIKKSYCYKNLEYKDFNEVLSYLAGDFASLEDRYVYAKIWKNEGKIGKKGKLGRVIYMTNIGTIPDESYIVVKIGDQVIGHLDENFLERLKPGDIFVLGGSTYEFRFARGMVAQVKTAEGKKPTIPSWFSEMLPLSFDLALDIQKFRWLMEDKFQNRKSKENILNFINNYLYVDNNAAEAIYGYFYDQYKYLHIPNHKKIVVEHFIDENNKYYILFHSLYGRRVNDVLSRALAFAIGRNQHRDVEVGINDNGFYISCPKRINALQAFKLLKSDQLRDILKLALDKSEVLKRRFRHCAARAFMILRNYKGQTKRVGRQQVSSMLLLSAVRRISDDFCILKEARREVLEDLMDIGHAIEVLKLIEEGKTKVIEFNTMIPSPFSFNLILESYSDILKMEDRHEFLKRMHNMIKAKISLQK
ncbi:ATP-dependent helicase [Candidatus Woesearchaeota archaeon]|nr:ATP-dependent helicase [Candidatus Woesearchaeota archaeon]